VQANDTKLSEQLGSVHGWNIKHILYCYNIPFKILYTDHTAAILFLRFLVLKVVNIMITSNPLMLWNFVGCASISIRYLQ